MIRRGDEGEYCRQGLTFIRGRKLAVLAVWRFRMVIRLDVFRFYWVRKVDFYG